MERVAGIEPAQSAWKAEILPLNYTRISKVLLHYSNEFYGCQYFFDFFCQLFAANRSNMLCISTLWWLLFLIISVLFKHLRTLLHWILLFCLIFRYFHIILLSILLCLVLRVFYLLQYIVLHLFLDVPLHLHTFDI